MQFSFALWSSLQKNHCNIWYIEPIYWAGLKILCAFELNKSVSDFFRNTSSSTVFYTSGFMTATCYNYAWYWISWCGRVISTGVGKVVKQNVLMNYNTTNDLNPMPPGMIQHIAVSGHNSLTPVNWSIPYYYYLFGKMILFILMLHN